MQEVVVKFVFFKTTEKEELWKMANCEWKR